MLFQTLNHEMCPAVDCNL